MEIEALPAESPKLYLNTYEVTVEAGNNLDKTSYIKEMTDDADSRESLLTKLRSTAMWILQCREITR